MTSLYLGEAVALVWLGPSAARRFVADLPLERWRPAGPYQSVVPLCRQPAQAAGSQEIESLEVPIRETWYVLRSDSDPNGPVPQPPKLNPSVPADHSLMAIDGEPPEKGWTGEIVPGPVTDSVEILGASAGAGRFVTYIGPG